MIVLRGSTMFRQRIVCATLSGKHVRIKDIRLEDQNPGLRDYEVSFLRLMEKITNGCTIEINETGTQVVYKPGVIVGGEDIVHDCGLVRGIGYFLEGLICLLPFGKVASSITLLGVTNEKNDISADVIRTTTLASLQRFGLEDLELKVAQRGALPLGGGKVIFKCGIVKTLKPVVMVDEGKINKVRGIAYSTRVSPQIGNRIVESARSVLNDYLPNVFLYTDHYRGTESGLSPGFGLALVAESTTGALLSVEQVAEPGELPEDLGKMTAYLLLEEVYNRGVVDTTNQSFMLLFMVLCQEDVSKIRLGKLSPHTILFLRVLKEFFGVQFKVDPDHETKTTVLTCVGSGFKNIAKKIY
eukprot:TRINITY_DN15572_c0_g1_i1.p1 TRINITY_DN15572_c0_g1~~TRINITY_DN15572_c0_g1_i1.p1  ORF type:complete len:388 (-),score=79.54 TRINITY_DN15572_c0_g1_i1:17-1084(-)